VLRSLSESSTSIVDDRTVHKDIVSVTSRPELDVGAVGQGTGTLTGVKRWVRNV
jgi:hypothetical protein